MTTDKRSVRTEAVDDVQVELSRAGALVDNTNPVPVEVVEGGSSPQAVHRGSASLAPAGTETLAATVIPSATTGRVQSVTCFSEGAWTAVLQSNDGVTQTPIATFGGEANEAFTFRPRNARASLYELAGDGTGTQFEVVVTNAEPSAVGASHTIAANIEWDEE